MTPPTRYPQVPYILSNSKVHYHADPCCTYATCTQTAITYQQAHNLTSFAYTTSDPYQRTPAIVTVAIGCPQPTPPTPAILDLSLARATIIALAVVGSLVVACGFLGGTYYRHHRHKQLKEMRILAEENEHKVQAAEHEAHMAAKEQEQLRRYASFVRPPCHQPFLSHIVRCHGAHNMA